VGEFDFMEAQTSHGVLVKVCAPKGRSDSGKCALECATRCLDAHDDFFGMPCPLLKLDMVAIPAFASSPVFSQCCKGWTKRSQLNSHVLLSLFRGSLLS
jgi:hypothetical protein